MAVCFNTDSSYKLLILFFTKRKNMQGIVLELKADDTPEMAIAQIKKGIL